MLIFYLVLFLTLAVFMLSIGLKVLLKKKPIFIHTRWLLILAAFAFSPMAINSIVLLIKMGLPPKSLFLLFNLLIYILIVSMFSFAFKGYSFIGVTQDSFIEGLHVALNKLNIKFEETLSCIKFLEYDSQLQVSIQPWMGTAQIKVKGKEDKQLVDSILSEMNVFFQNSGMKTNKIIPVFYVLMGSFIVLGIIATGVSFRNTFNNFSYFYCVTQYNDLDSKAREALLLKSIRQSPRFAQAYNELAWQYAKENRNLDQALKLADKAIFLKPQIQFFDTKAEVLYRMGRYQEAVNIESDVVKRYPEYQFYRDQLEKFKKEIHRN